MQIVTPIIKECDYVDIYIDGEKAVSTNYLLYPAIFRTIVDGSILWSHYVNKVSLDHVIKAIAVKDSTEEVLFERKLSYETLQWLAERRGEEKLFHNTRYGMASM
jgi:hypothetical protein